MTPPSSAIRVLHADDHPLAQAGIKALLAVFPDMELIGGAASGEEAVALCARLRPDVVLMDALMPGMGGVAATAVLCRELPATRVILLSSSEDGATVSEALRAGAAGYLLKTASAFEVAQAIRAAASGRSVLAPEAADALVRQLHAPHGALGELTERERQVLHLMSEGLSNAQIASMLKISLSTAKFHAKGVFTKFGVASRTEAIALAYKYGLV